MAARGNTLRPSTALPGQRVVSNLPEHWPTEEWHAYYWTVTPAGELQPARVVIRLPQGYAEACAPVRIGEPGCVAHVRRWGVACRMALLEKTSFDLASLPGLEDRGALYWAVQATHFDLPGDFIIASYEHPFLLFAPDGTLAGSDIHWYTYLGALAYFVSDGRVASTFGRLWWEDRALYQEAVGYLLAALGGKNDAQDILDLFDHCR